MQEAISKTIVDPDQEAATVAKLESEGRRVVSRAVNKEGKVQIVSVCRENPTGRPGIKVSGRP